MRFRSRPLATGALALAAFGLGAVWAPHATAQQRSCVDTLAGMTEFSRFNNAIARTSVVNEMRSANAITIFAPTDEALRQVNPVMLDRFFPRQAESGSRQADPVEAPAALGAHIVQGTRNLAALSSAGQLTSVAGTPLTVSGSQVTGASGASATITQADILCSNGVIHAIDAPLIR
jgi:uncharacterized surface protein with fasciclin (FAS1) repeats